MNDTVETDTKPSPELNTASAYELCFRSLLDPDHALAFPCDALGHVDLDGLSERDRSNYLYARAVMGRDLSAPAVQFSLTD